ncbi:hypothetical protein ACQKCU_20415 [Heyndrickxia sporothermodurans]
MERAVVFNAQQFLGFEICKELLNKGYEVLAIEHKGMVHDVNKEKWLEIGRNANVTYQLMGDKMDFQDPTYNWFVPLYDFISEKEDSLFDEWLYHFQRLYDEMKCLVKKIIFINPSQWLNDSTAIDQVKRSLMDKVINRSEIAVLDFYLPTIFGPWQPNTFLFQQIISKVTSQCYVDDCGDAIYIENAIHAIFQHIDEQLCGEKILLKSREEDMWEKCIFYLSPEYQSLQIEKQRNLTYSKSIEVEEIVSFKEGLKRQMDCYLRKMQ